MLPCKNLHCAASQWAVCIIKNGHLLYIVYAAVVSTEALSVPRKPKWKQNFKTSFCIWIMSAVALVTVFVWWAWRTFLFKYHQFVHYSNNYSSVYSKSQAAVSSVRRKGGNCNQELICCVIAHYHTVLAGLEDCQAWGLWPIRASKPGPLDGCAKYGNNNNSWCCASRDNSTL